MRDQDDGLALFLEQAQDFKQRGRFLRRQHGRRLVEDQDIGAAVNLLEDFHALLRADGEVLDLCQRVDVEAVARANFAQLGFRFGAVAGQTKTAFRAQHDIVEDGEILDQHEVLVHHADAEVDRFLAVADRLYFPVEQDFSAVGTVIPVQDAHQGRFAGAVFPHQAMDTALGDGEADVGVRLHMSKLLGNAAKFYCWLHRFITG